MSRPGRPPLTAAQQLLWLRKSDICTGRGILNRKRFTWTFEVQPSPWSRTYEIRIEFAVEQLVSVLVTKPDLHALAKGAKLPHVYADNPPRLCLFLPNTGEWEPWMRLDQTIVPWTFLWLEYFESWLVDGIWKGGGVHPDS